MQIEEAAAYSSGSPMKYKVTVEVLKSRYEREYDSDAGPKEILEGYAMPSKPSLPCIKAHDMNGR
jgi:hypothetical protein